MQLDVRGEMCPYPAMRTREMLKKLPGGEVLEVLTDHSPALSTVPFEGARQGYAAEIDALGSAEWRITLRKANDVVDPAREVGRVAARLAELGVTS